MTHSSSTTPLGNTGLKFQDTPISVSVDWLQFTVRVTELKFLELANLFGAVTSDLELVITRDSPITKGITFQHTARTLHGSMYAWNSIEGSDLVHGWVSLPAAVIRRAEFTEFWLVCQHVRNHFEPRVTRVDVSLDDFQKTLPVETVISSLEKKNYVRFSSYTILQNGSSRLVKDGGWTIYFGSRNSDKLVRYYNKSVESGGVIDSYRFEVEFKDFKAREFWEVFSREIPETGQDIGFVAEFMKEVVLGAIDFRDRSVDENISRCPRLDWWSLFIDHCSSSGGVKLPAKRIDSSISKTLDWLYSQVETSIALIFDIYGGSVFNLIMNRLIAEGRQRYSARHLSVISAHRDNLDPLPSAV